MPKKSDEQTDAASQLEALDAQLQLAEGQMREKFPLLSAVIDKLQESGREPAGIRITSSRDGFRRAGVAHSRAPVEYAFDRFGPEGLELLLGEPNLLVEII